MKLSDTMYNILKWVGLVCLPALSWYVLEVGDIAGIANPEGIAKILSATGTLLGLLIGVSTYNYNNDKAREEDD